MGDSTVSQLGSAWHTHALALDRWFYGVFDSHLDSLSRLDRGIRILYTLSAVKTLKLGKAQSVRRRPCDLDDKDRKLSRTQPGERPSNLAREYISAIFPFIKSHS